MSRYRKLVVQSQTTLVYNPDRVQALYEQLRPDPDRYGNDPAYALYCYLADSAFGSDVFEESFDFDQWPESDEEYDPDA